MNTKEDVLMNYYWGSFFKRETNHKQEQKEKKPVTTVSRK